MLKKCPYVGCDYEADTEEEVDGHVVYMTRIGDEVHQSMTIHRGGDFEFGEPETTFLPEQIVLGFNMGTTDDMRPQLLVRDEGDRPDSHKIKALDHDAVYQLWFDQELLDWVVRRV